MIQNDCPVKKMEPLCMEMCQSVNVSVFREFQLGIWMFFHDSVSVFRTNRLSRGKRTSNSRLQFENLKLIFGFFSFQFHEDQ